MGDAVPGNKVCVERRKQLGSIQRRPERSTVSLQIIFGWGFRVFYPLFSLDLSFPHPRHWVFRVAFSLVASAGDHLPGNTFLVLVLAPNRSC